MNRAAFAVERTANRKTGPISVTHASQASCPVDCALKGAGCYAESGMQGIHTRRLNAAPVTAPLAIAKQEAHAIGQLSGKRLLRIGIVGDKRSNAAARTIATAARQYIAKAGQAAYAYTHAWRTVDRASWGPVSVLASCETLAEVRQAERRGYATALVVAKYESQKAYRVTRDRQGRYITPRKVIPCPATIRDDVTCDSCRLCAKGDFLRATKATIAFEAHSAGQKQVRAVLQQGRK